MKHSLLEIKNLIANVLQIPVAEIADATELNSIPQWDSLGHVQILLSLEENYGVEINDTTVTKLTSLAAILEHLNGAGE